MDILCGRCKKNMTKYVSLPCVECINSRKYQEEIKRQEKQFKMGKQLVGRFKEPTAFGVDKATGRPWALDRRGKKFDPMQTRYAQYPDDRFGWKATGKIKSKKKYFL